MKYRQISRLLLLPCLLLLLLSACGSTNTQTSSAPADGRYTIQVTLTGGTGRASVQSPAELVVSGDTMTATIVWSSPFYEYMLVNDVRFEPMQKEGNSTFCIPVVLDTDMAVSASTAAMSQPHLIDYVLRFDASTLQGE